MKGFDEEALKRVLGDKLFGAWRLPESGALLLVLADAPPLPTLREESRVLDALVANGGLLTPEILGPPAARFVLETHKRDPTSFPPIFQVVQVVQVVTPGGRANLLFAPRGEEMRATKARSLSDLSAWERMAESKDDRLDQSELSSTSLVIRSDTVGDRAKLSAEAAVFFSRLVEQESAGRLARWQRLMQTASQGGQIYRSLPARGGFTELSPQDQAALRQKLLDSGAADEATVDLVLQRTQFRVSYQAALVMFGSGGTGSVEYFSIRP
ncbi:MAG: hypothetical protein MH204_06905 [Fimbriimonadaceae bacterium]|nr:hypothetical protein [Fimbriimonadaceae bacterium]